MSKTYRMCVVLLSAVVVLAIANPQVAVGQSFRSSSSKDKDKDKDEDDKDRGDRKRDKDKDRSKDQSNNNQGGQNNQGNQGAQGGQSNQSGQSNPGNQNTQGGGPANADKSSKQQAIEQYLKAKQGQGTLGGQNNNSLQKLPATGNSNRINSNNNPSFPGRQFPQQGQSQGFRDNDRDNDRDRDRDRDRDDDRDQKNAFKIGVWQGDRWTGSRKLDNWTQAYGGVSGKPFSSQWYKEHPRAWRFDKGEQNFWVAASGPGVYNWLGWGNAPQQYNVGIGNVQVDFSRFGQWYPLGVYSLMSGGDDQGTRVVQLAIDRRGRVAGNYYDMIVDSSYDISGEVRQSSQRLYFSLDRNPSITFRASLYSLLQPWGNITVQMPGGDQRWQFVRLEN